MSMILNARGEPISSHDEMEFNPFTDDELVAMDASTRREALRGAEVWWKAEQKRRRKADKRARERLSRDEDQ